MLRFTSIMGSSKENKRMVEPHFYMTRHETFVKIKIYIIIFAMRNTRIINTLLQSKTICKWLQGFKNN